jgi:ABC-type transport system involved in multi-copper enzyme maturation permease subunit
MIRRIAIVAYNSYREAVRARVLHGLFALALGSGAYALAVGSFSGRARLRAISDIGAASISLFGIVVAVVLGATSLYRELELKTIFPILAKPIRRGEYLIGKYIGIVLTVGVFVAANTGALLFAVAHIAGSHERLVLALALAIGASAGAVAFLVPRLRTALPIYVAVLVCVTGALLSSGAPDDRQVLLVSALLCVLEVAVVTAIATLFAAFSSPFLTAVFTLGVFVVGRSADMLSSLPARIFGDSIRGAGQLFGKLVPNLMLYVPERPLLTGEATGVSLSAYVSSAGLYALAWVVGLLTLSTLIFRRRDFL